MKKQKKRHLYKVLLALCGITIFVIYSCRKIDSSAAVSTDLTSKFFQIKGAINPTVQKVYEKVKLDNERYHQINKLAHNEGLAIWDKAIIKTKKSKTGARGQQQRTADGGEEEIVIIPLVLENAENVNSFLAAKITDTVEIKLFSGNEYDNFPFQGFSLPETTAEKIATTIMFLDNEVFNYTRFKLLDTRLFNASLDSISKGKQRQVVIKSNQNLRIANGTICVLVETGHCTCTDGDCDMCLTDCAWELCLDITAEGGTPVDFGFNPIGNSGLGGSLGGNGYTGGGGGSSGGNLGWTPIEDVSGNNNNQFPKNPCENVDSLLKTNNFKTHLNTLRSSTPIHHEKGISFTTPDTSNTTHTNYTGQGTLAVQVAPTSPVDGIMHNHYDTSVRLPLFSAEDIAALVYHFNHNEIKNLSTFTCTVVTDSTSYLLMITDSTAFANIANTWFNTEKHFYAFKKHLYINNHYGDTTATGAQLTPLQNEKNFLEAFDAAPFNGAGLKLFRGNPDMTIFTPIKINNQGMVRPAPCN
jgi:hypothetical protein